MNTNTDRKPLTERQREILRWLSRHISDNGFSPTVREMCRAFKFSAPNGALCHLLALRRKGWIDWHDGKSRTIRLRKVVAQ